MYTVECSFCGSPIFVGLPIEEDARRKGCHCRIKKEQEKREIALRVLNFLCWAMEYANFANNALREVQVACWTEEIEAITNAFKTMLEKNPVGTTKFLMEKECEIDIFLCEDDSKGMTVMKNGRFEEDEDGFKDCRYDFCYDIFVIDNKLVIA